MASHKARPLQQRAVQPIPQSPPTVDFSGDPILAQIQALAQQNIAAAEAATLAGRQKAMIAFGYDPALASLYGDSNTQKAAQQNPFSTLANLKQQDQQNQTNINQSTNKQNLFYSSYRGQQLQNEQRQYLASQAAANQALQNSLGGLSANLLAAHQNAQGQIQQGQSDAYNRALSQALQYGQFPQARRAPRGAPTWRHF